MRFSNLNITALFVSLLFLSCKEDPGNPETGSTAPSYEFWLTNGDKSVLFQKQSTSQQISGGSNLPNISIDPSQTFQSIDGFGCALTGGSAMLINAMGAAERAALLHELFAVDGKNIGISYLRISIGASDLDDHVFSYNDLPAGQTDTAMTHFSLDPDRTNLIPILKEILAINPDVKILGSPWSAPTWMKTNNNSIGGSLKPQYYAAYAKYFVKYIHGMAAEGIHIDAITVQNEPLYGGNNPSMVMQASEQANFIKNHLGPAFADGNIDTKIIIYDHNADRTDYPIAVLNDTAVRKYVDGSAFHLYGGTIDALSNVHNAHPDKNLYFTEQWIGAPGNFPNDLKWHLSTLVIGGTRNWCKAVLEWNLAADPDQNPHTPGGCTQCLGAITINGNTVVRNPAYYIIAHASKFVRPGSVRIASTEPASLTNAAFKTADGKIVLIVVNSASTPQVFTITVNGKTITSLLNGGAAGTYIIP